MPTLRVDPTTPGKEAIARAAEVIRRGGLVAFPTETVYGLGANALDEAAVDRLYAAKGRPSYNPLIVHVADITGARALAERWPEGAARLAHAFWPGPLTLVVPRGPRVPGRVSAGLPTLAIRVPDHPVALALLRAAGIPIVAPSANPSGAVSPTRAEHVERGLGDRVDLILDGGPTEVGIESTVVDLTGDRPALLRPGGVSVDDLRPHVGALEPASGEAPRSSPGMLDRHYAPRAALHVFESSDADDAVGRARRAADEGRTVGLILLDRTASAAEAADSHPRGSHPLGSSLELDRAHHVVRLPGDAAGYARQLYDALHRLDASGCDLILVEDVPATAGWAGVRDRLRRAADETPA